MHRAHCEGTAAAPGDDASHVAEQPSVRDHHVGEREEAQAEQVEFEAHAEHARERGERAASVVLRVDGGEQDGDGAERHEEAGSPWERRRLAHEGRHEPEEDDVHPHVALEGVVAADARDGTAARERAAARPLIADEHQVHRNESECEHGKDGREPARHSELVVGVAGPPDYERGARGWQNREQRQKD